MEASARVREPGRYPAKYCAGAIPVPFPRPLWQTAAARTVIAAAEPRRSLSRWPTWSGMSAAFSRAVASASPAFASQTRFAFRHVAATQPTIGGDFHVAHSLSELDPRSDDVAEPGPRPGDEWLLANRVRESRLGPRTRHRREA